MFLELATLAVTAAFGSGLMAGLFFAFSNFVMRALLSLPPEHGMKAMQEVNVKIVNPVFLSVFVVTPIACAAVIWQCAQLPSEPGAGWLFAGALAYLLGPLGVTVAFNVPLNNKLAQAKPLEAPTVWPSYAAAWTCWNHLRTALAAAATVLLVVGVYKLA